MATLALLVIALDEELGLPSAIDSVRTYVDEIVVAVDSRTRDRTREVAAAAGARVVDLVFEDFAQMRAAGVAAVTSDWVLMLDGDEILEGDPRPLMNKPVIWELPRRHWMDLARTTPAPADALFPDRQRRLFPNDPRVVFERPVHEYAAGMKAKRTKALMIHHFKEALRSAAEIEQRSELYAELKERGLREGWKYRKTD